MEFSKQEKVMRTWGRESGLLLNGLCSCPPTSFLLAPGPDGSQVALHWIPCFVPTVLLLPSPPADTDSRALGEGLQAPVLGDGLKPASQLNVDQQS